MKGFTLVELLAVIVILAIILVIAVPQIMNVIKDTTKASLESSAKMVAAQVENQYTVAQTLGKDFGGSGSCMKDWAGLNTTDYESCTYKIDSNGNAKVTLVGKGKFKDLSICNGTRSSAAASEDECVFTGVDTISELCENDIICTSNNLLKDEDGNIRYYGANPNNYISFNNEVWRIIGIFNVKTNASDTTTEQRIKIVRDDLLEPLKPYSIDNFYDTLNATAKGQMDKAVWNTGMYEFIDYTPQSKQDAYIAEKSVQTEESFTNPIYISDYGYAGGSTCTNIKDTSCGTSNWLKSNTGYWTMTSSREGWSGYSYFWMIYQDGYAFYETDEYYTDYDERPSLYLKSNIKLTGTGENTEEGIYRIS